MTDNIYIIRVPIVVDAIYYSKAENEETALAQVKELVDTNSLELEGIACFAYRAKGSVDTVMSDAWEVTVVPDESENEVNSYFFEPDDDYELEDIATPIDYDDWSDEDYDEWADDGWYYE